MRYVLFVTIAAMVLIAGLSYATEKRPLQKVPMKEFAAPPVVYFTKDISSAGMQKVFEQLRPKVKGTVGLKVHFGEEGNKYYVKPELMKELAVSLKATLIETNVLYVGPRRYTKSHLELAKKHGFTFAPIDILDAEGDTVYKAEGLKHYKEVHVGSHLSRYNTIVVLSHFKGHQLAGFGGAIKNVAMGLGSIAGKMAMHSSTLPTVNSSKCITCMKCIGECPGKAITVGKNKVVIDPEKCVGCGKCIGVCPKRVFGVPWSSTDQPVFLERLVEYAKVIQDNNSMLYISVITDVSPDCDCMGSAAEPFVTAVGILASTDMVAIDTAAHDLVDKAAHSSDAFKKHSGVSGRPQLEYAEKIGLGRRSYRLINIDAVPKKDKAGK